MGETSNIVKIEDAIIRRVVRDDKLGATVDTNVRAILGQLDVDRLIADPQAELDAMKSGIVDAFNASFDDYFKAGHRYARELSIIQKGRATHDPDDDHAPAPAH